jgi:hypothetical protein
MTISYLVLLKTIDTQYCIDFVWKTFYIVRQSLYLDCNVHKVLYTLTLLANSILPPPPLPVLPVTEDNNPKIGFI